MLTKYCWLASMQEKPRHREVRVKTLGTSSWIRGCCKGGERTLKTNLAYFKILLTAVIYHCKYLHYCSVLVTPVILAHHHYNLHLFVCVCIFWSPICVSSCLLNNSIWIFDRHLKFKMSKNKIQTFPLKPAPPRFSLSKFITMPSFLLLQQNP